MRLTRYQTNWPLWIGSALSLFIVSLLIHWVPFLNYGESEGSPLQFASVILHPPHNFGIAYQPFILVLSICAVFAILFGWMCAPGLKRNQTKPFETPLDNVNYQSPLVRSRNSAH